MTNDPTTNKNTIRQQTDSSIMDKHSKSNSYFLTKYFSPVNLMQFVEISPLNPINKPHPRSGHRGVATESDFWIWGGYYPSGTSQAPSMFNEVCEIFDRLFLIYLYPLFSFGDLIMLFDNGHSKQQRVMDPH
jgi:hypothetical protein